MLTLAVTVTLIMESASAPPMLRGTTATGVRQVTGVMTPPRAARYIHTHTHTHTPLSTCHRCVKCLCLFSHAAAVQQEAPPHSVTRLVVSVCAETGSQAGHVTSVNLVTMVTQHAQHVVATGQEQMRHSATQRRRRATVDTLESVYAR